MVAEASSKRHFFLISFLPAIAYWYLEEHYPVKIAVLGGIGLALLEILVEWFFVKHVHNLSKFNFFLMLFLGALSLWGGEGVWFKLQPCFTGIAIGLVILFKSMFSKGLLWEMMAVLNTQAPPYELWRFLEIRLGLLLFGYGIFMGLLALFFSTDYWLFFKTIGFYIIFFIYLAFEFVYLKVNFQRLSKKRLQKEILNSMRPRK